MEEVLHEIRVVETEDGYRVEIKGDKEHMKKFLKEHKRGLPCPPPFFMPFMAFQAMRHGWRHGHHGPPWGWDCEEEDETESA